MARLHTEKSFPNQDDEPDLDCDHTFPIVLELNGFPFGILNQSKICNYNFVIDQQEGLGGFENVKNFFKYILIFQT